MPNCWDFKRGTEQVYQLLCDLSQDLKLWGRFFDDPFSIITDYGLSIPENIIQDNLCFRKRPSAALFASELDWVFFENKYLKDASCSIRRLDLAHQDEIWLTLNGTKPAARLMVGEEYIGTLVHFLQDKRVPFVLSPSKTVVESDKNKGGYANLVSSCLSLDAREQGMFIVYLSVDGARVQTALLLEVLRADRELGRILGYPECCIEFFVDNFAKTRETQGDLAPFSLLNTSQPPPYPFYLNNLARYFGVQLIRHFPCCYTCATSTALGKQYLQVLQKDARERAQRLLLCPIVYSDTKGVFLLEEFSLLSDGGLAYAPDRIRATDETTDLYRLLRAADRIKVLDWNGGGLAFYRGGVLTGQIDAGVWCLTFVQDQKSPHHL